MFNIYLQAAPPVSAFLMFCAKEFILFSISAIRGEPEAMESFSSPRFIFAPDKEEIKSSRYLHFSV